MQPFVHPYNVNAYPLPCRCNEPPCAESLHSFCAPVYMRSCSLHALLQSTVGYAKTNDSSTNECYNEQLFLNKIRMLQRTKMLQQTRRNTIGRRNTRVRMTCRTFPLCLERQSSYLLSFVRFICQFSSGICAFSSENIFLKLFCYIILALGKLFKL
jgi:hypothetical protein